MKFAKKPDMKAYAPSGVSKLSTTHERPTLSMSSATMGEETNAQNMRRYVADRMRHFAKAR